MELLLLLTFASYLLVGVLGSHAAALPSEVYWKNKLPNTPMPTILHDSLRHDQEGKHLTDRARDGYFWIYSKNTPKHLSDRAGDGYFWIYSKNTPKHLTSDRAGDGYFWIYSKTNQPLISKSTIPKGSNTDDAATNRQLQDNPDASLFFLEKDLHPGAKMSVHFVSDTATFLPQKLAKVTPFSSNKLPEILNQFGISPKSKEAGYVSETITACEEPAKENEEKYCATSLESLVDFGTSKFGKNVNVLTTEIVGDKRQRTRMGKQQYAVGSGVRQIVSDSLVACHSLPYLYAVFYCHTTAAHTTRTYVVPLDGADGVKIKATAVCHKDTSKWNPDHLAFQVLKVKPGTVPICHFLTQDTIVWVAKNNGN